MKKTLNIFLIVFSFVLFQNCEEDQFESSLNYVSFGDDTYSAAVDVDGTTTVDVTVYTTSIVSSDTSFNVEANGEDAADGSYSVPTSVTIPAGSNSGTLTVTLSDIDLGIGVNALQISFIDVVTGYSNGSSTTIEYIQNCNEVSGSLDFVFDGYASEVAWEITDSLGGVVVSGSGYSDGDATASETIVLCAGRDYTFTITDSYGDGLSYPSNGTYTLTIGGEIKANGGGDYGDSESTDFDTM
ncbi:hypothetical protein [Neotamlana laminarinivorans]|uniref:Uncharacterized protein n=1 Tax=Neotamlana laminarinivorans TaxID=2883124 RepID=A0A9X1I2W8_9FLAO|nr:hypothetical protein [Tamlana laminarinivorans]MCB4799232.1 hypothetical protein [Tamlana laminarinivorans]